MSEHIEIQRDVMVPMRDGIRLRTDVYLPPGDGPFPALLSRTPYHPSMSAAGMTFDPNVGLAQLGYAVVSQHCRGRFGSEGNFHALVAEVDDGYDAVEWVAGQPWSNGRVGMVGGSYGGMTQWSAVRSRPPHLVAVTPASCPWTYFDGIPYAERGVLALDIDLAWTAFMARHEAEVQGVDDAVLLQVPQPWDVGKALGEGEGSPLLLAIAEGLRAALLPLLDQRPAGDIDTFLLVAPWWKEWLANSQPEDAYWAQVSPASSPGDVDVPCLLTTGWYDTFLPGALHAFGALRGPAGATREGASGTRMIIGFWGHGTPGEHVDGHLAGMDMNAAEAAAGAHMVQFLDRWVKGNDAAPEPAPITLYVIGRNEWRDEHEWPLARTAWTPYYLQSGGRANREAGDGTLSTRKAIGGIPDEFQHDPGDPVPQRGGPVVTLMSLPGPGPFDQRPIEERADVLLYTSDVLVDDVEVTGPVQLRLWAATSAPATDFTAKLVDVFPDGRAINLCQGLVRTCCHEGEHQVAEPGVVRAYAIDMSAISNVFMAGHRIRLEVASSCYPTYDVNPNTGRHLVNDATNETVVATQTVYHDPDRPSHLVLPVIPVQRDERPR